MSSIIKLKKGNIVDIFLDKNKTTINFIEACDFYYKIKLNKKEVKELIIELKELENKIIEK